MRWSTAVLLLFLLSCNREKPAAPAAEAPLTPQQTPAQTAPAARPPAAAASYERALDWLRSTKGYHFVLEENGSRVEGDLVRPRIGEERLQFRGDSGEWLGVARRTGVAWYRREGGQWKHERTPPPLADKVWMRLTFVVDPQKKEGTAQAAGEATIDGEECSVYRFTNANSGDEHELCVSRRDAHVVSMKVDGMQSPAKLMITKPDEVVKLDDPGKEG